MHTIDLKNFNLRTDLIIDEDYYKNDSIKDYKTSEVIDNITVEEIKIEKDTTELFNKKEGIYKTIIFDDVTDKNNFKNVEKVFIKTLKKFLSEMDIKEDDKGLIIGLGNDLSTPDALGPKTIDNILVTRHLFSLGSVEEGYREISSFKPGVTGTTGIETQDMVKSLVNIVKPNFLIVIDALASSSIDRLNKTIQITDSGINPGSGIGNNRKELSKDTLGIKVIAIGIPTVVDATTIVNDTFYYMLKQLSFKVDNINNNKLKLVPNSNLNYKDHDNDLTKEEKQKVLGMVGTLDEAEFKSLIYEVLVPINSNLMVTPKEVDFIIDKLALLLSSGINKSLHKQFNPTN